MIPMSGLASVNLPNILDHEGFCECGCGKASSQELLVLLQAFVYMVERTRGKKVRVHWHGARCQSHNNEIPGSAKFSEHLNGQAADCKFEEYDGTRWHPIDSATIAAYAIGSGLWGGIGWKKYHPVPGHIHLDIRPGRKAVIW